MKLTRYALLVHPGTFRGDITIAATYRTHAEALAGAQSALDAGGVEATVQEITVDVEPPPLKVATLAADATLVISTPELDPAAGDALSDALTAAIGDRWLVIGGSAAMVPAALPESAAAPATGGQDARERLPWSHYAPELATRLAGLTQRFDPWTVADAAVTLAELIDEHGPEAVNLRRRRKDGDA